jgi:hypothetical protein
MILYESREKGNEEKTLTLMPGILGGASTARGGGGGGGGGLGGIGDVSGEDGQEFTRKRTR